MKSKAAPSDIQYAEQFEERESISFNYINSLVIDFL